MTIPAGTLTFIPARAGAGLLILTVRISRPSTRVNIPERGDIPVRHRLFLVFKVIELDNQVANDSRRCDPEKIPMMHPVPSRRGIGNLHQRPPRQ